MQEKFNVANHYAFLQNSGKGFLYDLKDCANRCVTPGTYIRPWSHSGLFTFAYCYSDTNFCQFIADCTRIKSLCISKGIVCKKLPD